jgi:diguanylate cyclase (GGDEF)-like protein
MPTNDAQAFMRLLLGRFLLFGVVLAPLLSCLVVEFVQTIELNPAHLLGMANWFIGDAIGIGIMTPLVLAVERTAAADLFSRTRRIETIGILVGITALTAGVFAQRGLPIVFILFPALLLAIFRLGSSGAAIGVFLMTVPAGLLTVLHRGPFSTGTPDSLMHSIFLLQCFLAVSLVTIYSVSAALAERNRLQEELVVAYHKADANAGTDHVTGLANRRTFDKHLALEWRRAIRENLSISLVMIDVDQFKLYNDHYGHLAGDACLRTIGSILANASLRATDLVARYGGEEFAVVLPRATAQGAALIAGIIRQAVSDRCLPHLPYAAGIVTLSLGVASIHPKAEWDETLLIQLADQALYQAKKDGRNCVKVWEGVLPEN